MSLPGPSSFARVDACITSEALPQARSSSEHSARGTVVHDFLAACVNSGRDAALELAPAEYRDVLELIPLDSLPPLDPTKYAAEVSFAYDTTTRKARELGRGLKRDEARAMAREHEVVGTCDLVGVTEDAVVVFDWKSGWSRVDPAEVNWQTRSYALFAARAYGKSRAVNAIVRIPDDRIPWTDVAEMDSLDLDAHEVDMLGLLGFREEVLELAPEARPPLHEGDHCRYCPALPFCPAKQTLLATTFDTSLEGATLELTKERAGSAWRKIKDAKKLLERLEAVLRDYARSHPFHTDEEHMVGATEETRETIVAARMRDALKPVYGDNVVAAICEASTETKITVTKEAFKSALKKFVIPTLPKEKAKITWVERDALEALRKSGALSVQAFTKVGEFKVREPGEEG